MGLKRKISKTQIKYSDFDLGLQERSKLSTRFDSKGECFYLRTRFWNPNILFLAATTKEMLVNDENVDL
jgi:hypothetical protein